MKKKMSKFFLIISIAVVLIIALALWQIPVVFSLESSKLEVNFLDVGQGDSIFIKTPYGQNILIDGGPDRTVLRRLSEVLPWYDRTIDLMILTHPHDDHVGGLVYVLERYKVKKVLYTGVLHSAPAFLNWLEQILEKRIPLIIADKPQKINFGDNCYFDIIYPKSSLFAKEVDNLNNSSIVGKLVYGKTSFLFSGDAEFEVEKKLLNDDLKSDVYKAGHHGSITSSGQEFLNEINPSVVVVQVGVDNKFGHPSRRILKRFERLGIQVFRNDLDGTVRIFSDGDDILR